MKNSSVIGSKESRADATSGTWMNVPENWLLESDGTLYVSTLPGTDFWRETYYGFTHDSGHFFGFEATSEFTCQFRVRGSYEELYDQAGIMVRTDEHHWLKAGIELTDGNAMQSSVLTDMTSDWAAAAFAGNPADFWIRATAQAGVLRVQMSADGQHWPLLRLCPFPIENNCRVGPVLCSPKRAGLEVVFSDITLGPPTNKDLHDLS